jgi:outer membrane receptor for Fe3+-dicitrate
MQYISDEFNINDCKLKSIFELQKECRTFKISFQYSDYERSLYLGSGALSSLKPLKKSEMLRIGDN